MRVAFGELPADLVARYRKIIQDQGLGEGATFLPLRRVWLLWVGMPALAVGAFSAWMLRSGASSELRGVDALAPWAGLLGLLYGTLALVEYVRMQLATLKPFLLLTPLHLLRCLGSHRPLELYRLAEASSFERVEEYHGATWLGQAYLFKFDDGQRLRFVLKDRRAIEAASRTLALAKLAGRGEPLPDGPVRAAGDLCPRHLRAAPPRRGPLALLDPASEYWLVILLAAALAFILWAFLR